MGTCGIAAKGSSSITYSFARQSERRLLRGWWISGFRREHRTSTPDKEQHAAVFSSGMPCSNYFGLRMLQKPKASRSRRTQLWERWSAAGTASSPFGIILRPANPTGSPVPFPSRVYQPKSMPDLVLHVAANALLTEPMWCYQEAGRRPDMSPLERRQSWEHPIGFREITSVQISSPWLDAATLTRGMANTGLISCGNGTEHLLELEFDGNRNGRRADFRPDLPLVFRW